MKSWISVASITWVACALAGVACSGEDDPEQNTLPQLGNGGSAGSANTAGNGGAGGRASGSGGRAGTAAGGSGGQASGTGGRAAAGGSTSTGGSGGSGVGGSGVGGTGVGGTGVGGSAPQPDAGGNDPEPQANVGFVEDVYPIVTSAASQCSTCHGGQGRGNHNIASPNVNTAFADASRIRPRLLGRVDGGGMPPGCNTVGQGSCLTAAQVQTISDWIDAGGPRNRTP